MSTTRRKSGARKRRNPPKGYRSWKAYMASIRPGAKKRARSNPAGGSAVARKKRRKATSTAVARRNPSPRSLVLVNAPKKRRRYKRNPPAILKALPSFVGSAALGAVAATGGKILARKGRALVRQQAGTVFGMAAEAIIGVGAGIVIAQYAPQIGRDVALGGIQSPLEAAIARMKVPFVADALGADEYYLGYSDAVDSLQGYVEGDGRSQFGDEYVAGNIGNGGFVAA